MLLNDPLGSKREDASIPLNRVYIEAFEAIARDPNNELLVVELEGALVGMLQLTFIPYLTHTVSWRCLIEGVRIHSDYRGQGFGEQMFGHAIELAKKGCTIVQLTSDKQRPDAIRFYEKFGFKATHHALRFILYCRTRELCYCVVQYLISSQAPNNLSRKSVKLCVNGHLESFRCQWSNTRFTMLGIFWVKHSSNKECKYEARLFYISDNRVRKHIE